MVKIIDLVAMHIAIAENTEKNFESFGQIFIFVCCFVEFTYYFAMSENTPKRDYVMSDGNLRQLANNIIAFATRDIALLAPVNITAAKLSAINDLLVAFVGQTYDILLRLAVKNAVAAKNNKQKEIIDAINLIQMRAEMTYGVSSDDYKDFKFDEVNAANDAALPTAATVTTLVAQARLSELADNGQTAAELTTILSKCEEYIQLLTAVGFAETARRTAKEARIAAGNALFAAIGDIAIAGKALFIKTRPDLYPDYLLYPDAANTPEKSPKVNNVHYATPYLYWNEAPRAESYRVEVSFDGGATISTYEDDVEDSQIDVPMPSEGTAMYRVVAINGGGESEPSDWVVLVGSVGAPTGITYDGSGFHITPVANAESYHFKYGPVGGSVDAPETTEVFNSNTPDYGWTFPFTGTWIIYVRVKVAGVWSPWLVQEMTFA